MRQQPDARVTFMGDTQIGGDKEQAARLKETQGLVEEYKGNVDQAWHVGDLGTSSTAYEFVAAFKTLGKEDPENAPDEARKVQIEVRNALDKLFTELVAAGRREAAKYIMGDSLRGKAAKYPEVMALLKEFAKDARVQANEQLRKFLKGEGEGETLDMFKVITGQDVEFLEADEKAMVAEMTDALQTMANLTGEEGKIGVVPGNQETSNWQRVVEKVLPAFQEDVDLDRNPAFHEVSDHVGLYSLPYELDKSAIFDAKGLAQQAEGKETVIIGMHASPLMRGLAENIHEPLTVEAQKEKIVQTLGIKNQLDSLFDDADQKIKNSLLRRAGGFAEEEFNGKKLSEIVDLVAKRLVERSTRTYESKKAWDADRQVIIAKHGKPDRTPGSQPNPMNRHFRELVSALSDSVKTVVVPWGHLHSTSEKAMANHPWFRFDEEVQPQSFGIVDPLSGKVREIKFVYLPTAGVMVMDCYPDGVVDIKSLKAAVAEEKV